MDVADDFPLVHVVVIKRIPATLTVHSIPMLNASELRTKVIDVHSNTLLVISFKYITLVNLLAVAVVKSGELADAVSLHPRLRFTIADGECVIAIVYQAAIYPMAVGGGLGSEFNLSVHNFLILSVNSWE